MTSYSAEEPRQAGEYIEALQKAFPPDRRNRLAAEMGLAFGGMSKSDLHRWSGATADVLAASVWRRLKTLGGSLRRLGIAMQEGIAGAIKGTREKGLKDYAHSKALELWTSSKNTAKAAQAQIGALAAALRENPRDAGPRFLIAAMGFLLASGGVDADGGAPDLDLEIGIDAHRSIFFHSFLIGAVFETAIFGFAHAMELAHDKLPQDHDPFWDEVARHRAQWAEAAANGVSLGVAYHLLVDALIQTGSYHGIGVALPAEAHAGIQATNAAVEGMDVGRKRETFQRTK